MTTVAIATGAGRGMGGACAPALSDQAGFVNGIDVPVDGRLVAALRCR